jgi:hypothetical protein
MSRAISRRPVIGALALGFASMFALAAAGSALAVPTVTFSAKILPIPGFPHTGNILGAGADLETTFTIHGTEYDFGHPAPLRRVDVLFPKGTKITTKGFPDACTPAMLEKGGAAACKKEQAGPVGEANGVVNIGGEPIPEPVKVTPEFTANGLLFWVEGSSPAKIEIVSKGHWTTASGGPYGPEIVTEVPLIETLPGAPDASTESIRVKSGGAIRKGKKVIYYGTVPKSCPKGGFPAKAILSFGAGAESTWETATAEAKVPCPPGSAKHGKHGKKRHARRRHARRKK